MAFPNAKEIKKLADLCRKSGIASFKCPEFEFTLTLDAPESTYKKKKQKAAESIPDTPIETDLLSEEALLFWSSSGETTEGDLQ